MPGRDPPLHGLIEGFRPWQLASWAERPSKACQPDFWEGRPTQKVAQRLNADSVLSADVLAKSEFLLPLAEREHAMYRRVCKHL